jgi:hypothetical protein
MMISNYGWVASVAWVVLRCCLLLFCSTPVSDTLFLHPTLRPLTILLPAAALPAVCR